MKCFLCDLELISKGGCVYVCPLRKDDKNDILFNSHCHVRFYNLNTFVVFTMGFGFSLKNGRIAFNKVDENMFPTGKFTYIENSTEETLRIMIKRLGNLKAFL